MNTLHKGDGDDDDNNNNFSFNKALPEQHRTNYKTELIHKTHLLAQGQF